MIHHLFLEAIYYLRKSPIVLYLARGVIIVLFAFTLAVAEGGGSPLDRLGINGLAFISQLISFLIVLVLLSKLVLPRILQTLDKRQSVIREGIENAEQAKQDLTQAVARAEQIIADARQQAQLTIEQATKNAEQVARQIEEEAHQRAEQISQQQIARIQQEASRARQELSRQVVTLSIEAASKVVGRSLNTKDNRRLVEEFATL